MVMANAIADSNRTNTLARLLPSSYLMQLLPNALDHVLGDRARPYARSHLVLRRHTLLTLLAHTVPPALSSPRHVTAVCYHRRAAPSRQVLAGFVP
jgi:hypothetical protein